jgi:hypothetical protein
MATPSDIPIMLHEMALVGTGMSAAVTAAWATTLTVTHLMPKIVTVKETVEMSRVKGSIKA